MGYALIGANILYTVLSIPLALRYLGKEEFGLWALAQQIAGYLLLIDFGLSTAVSRLLANHKNDVNDGPYGALLVTGAFVFSLQGIFLFASGGVFALFAPTLFQIPTPLAADFRNLIIILAALSGVTVALRSITAPLWAFQRLDVSYGIGIISLLLGLTSLWLAFQFGFGIYSFALAGIPAMMICTIVGFEVCRRAGFYPQRGCWGRPCWKVFREMFNFGKDVTLMSIGSQLVNASQIMILGRVAGLEAAATFAVGTKFYALGSQLTGRLMESSAPALTEMFVQKDHRRLQERFNDIFCTSLFLATSGAVALLAANTTVVGWWTSDVIRWSFPWDILLGLLLIATTASRCLIGLFGISGNLRPVRNIYLLEAAVFIVAGIPAAASFGISGLLVASLVAHLLMTAMFSTIAARNIVGSLRTLRRPILLAATILVGAAIIAALLRTGQTTITYAGSAMVIFGFSVAAAATMLTTNAKDRIFGKLLGFSGVPRK
jgi:O-antigen/teichoic acid export membrane protein